MVQTKELKKVRKMFKKHPEVQKRYEQMAEDFKPSKLSIPKNHNQRMYKFGYDTARKELIEEVEKIIDNWLNEYKRDGKLLDILTRAKVNDLYKQIQKLKEK